MGERLKCDTNINTYFKISLANLGAGAWLRFGGMSDANKSLAGAEYNTENDFHTLSDKPYMEFGYGVENIFKVVRVDFYHRLSYLDHPNISKFGVKINFQLIL